jgi:DNA polymerase-3 subunit epsilon
MYSIVDIETTGGYAEYHRITEVAIYQFDGIRITDYYHTLVNPGRSIPYFITGLTGIDYELVRDAPSFEEVAAEIHDWLKDRVFVGHNAQFDYSFLKKEFETAGISWSAKKLCTVRLSRRIIPGLRSYSLGRLAESLGISIPNRHRAGGDAEATAKIFEELLRRDTDGHIAKALKRNSGETILPPNLSREQFDKLPTRPGVYYFLNERGEVIYVGKAINIKKRIAGHFTGDAREWNRQNVRNEIHSITYQLTGSELIALILESQEIHRLWPRYNLAQKYKGEEWGVFDYEDRNGYLRFSITPVGRGVRPLMSFGSKADAWNFVWEMVQEFQLCPKLCGLQRTVGACHNHPSGECKGACMHAESPDEYNQRAAQAADSCSLGESVAIVGKGRTTDEHSLVLIENGVYLGHGYFSKAESIGSLEEARRYVQPARTTPTVNQVINSVLVNPSGHEIISF